MKRRFSLQIVLLKLRNTRYSRTDNSIIEKIESVVTSDNDSNHSNVNDVRRNVQPIKGKG